MIEIKDLREGQIIGEVVVLEVNHNGIVVTNTRGTVVENWYFENSPNFHIENTKIFLDI